jgi:formate dehydrogenase
MPDGNQTPERPLDRMIHPGSGRRKAPPTPKGRQTDPDRLTEVRDVIGDNPRRQDWLIENLHCIQDRYGHLSAAHLTALAEEMKLPMAVVFEVASFYAHFDIVMDGEDPPPPLTIRVCDGIACEMNGANEILKQLPAAVGEHVRVLRAPCVGRCACAPVAEVGHHWVDHADVHTVAEAARAGRTEPDIPEHIGFDEYVAHGGYQLLRNCLNGTHSADDIVSKLSDSKLRGLGGAGFPTGKKWDIVRQQRYPRYVAINADEGEPGTFKDRWIFERDPHRFLEGTLLGCWVADAEACYIYLRDEYPQCHEILEQAIARLEREGLTGGCHVELRRGAGAYICGEESAMLESIEGKRGLPRHKPPFAAEVGLWGMPTLTNNVETMYWIRDIVERGPGWFEGMGRHGRSGLRLFSVSGRVKDPGVKLAPAGITCRELIEEYSGGMLDGHTLKAYLPGGASGGILPESHADIPLDFGTLDEYGCFLGSGAIVVLSDQDSTKDAALNLLRFFEDESCGQCTPCRNGTEKAVKLMERDHWDRELMGDLSTVMRDASICGLGQAAPNPIQCVFSFFPEDLR